MSEQQPPIDEDVNARGPFICFDRHLPDELLDHAEDIAKNENIANYVSKRAAIEHGKKWQPGRTLGIYYMDGDPIIQAKVDEIYTEWTKYANINFARTDNPKAEIRISFREPGSWSYIGTDALLVPSDKPTMNYGWLRHDTDAVEYRRVVLHEFGHALGLIHEHQNPATDIPWNKPAVYQYYSGAPNYWSRQQTDRNLFLTYGRSKTQFTRFDRDSIMLYPVEQRFTLGDFEVGWNKELSKLDKEFIERQYPGRPKAPNELQIGGQQVKGRIGELGEVDLYIFTVDGAGRFIVETHGRTDVSMSLFGPDSETRLVDEDDDSGKRLNAKISAVLRSGLYTVLIRHFSENRTGDYGVSVRRDT